MTGVGLPWWSSASPVVQCNAGDLGLIPGQGTKILHASEQLGLHTATTEPVHVLPQKTLQYATNTQHNQINIYS